MTVFELQKKFNTRVKCIKHLEKVSWGRKPVCPHCKSNRVSKRSSRKFFYHCNKCNKDFTVLYGTIFEGTKMSLPKWFMLIAIMLNARKGISAMNLMRDLGITYKTAWYAAMRVRCAMLDQADMLEGIVEMDESYFGGKPRKRNTLDNVASLGNVNTDEWAGKKRKGHTRGRGAENKVKVVGVVERGKHGKVSLKVQDTLTGADLLKILKRYVKMDNTTVMTDDFKSYKKFDKVIQHYTVNHSKKQYVKY